MITPRQTTPGWSPPARLDCAGVSLRPLTHADLPDLFSATDSGSFRFFLSEPSTWTLDAFTAWCSTHLFKPDQAPLLIVDERSGRIAGSSSFMDVLPPHRHVEIGCTWYAPWARGGHVNPAAKVAMLAWSFRDQAAIGTAANGPEGDFGLFPAGPAHRVTLKCDARNLHSQAAIAKLGAVREGTLRRHRVRPDGNLRDTVYFSIVADEWPTVRAGLQRRLELDAR